MNAKESQLGLGTHDLVASPHNSKTSLETRVIQTSGLMTSKLTVQLFFFCLCSSALSMTSPRLSSLRHLMPNVSFMRKGSAVKKKAF